MASSLVGRTLGNYRIVELLGQGGMATVYKGYREDIDRFVAIKVLPPHPGLDQQFIERFRLEARTIARLQHPHILPLYDYGAQEDILYLVMAYVEGGSLGDRIDRGKLSPAETENILRQVAGALDYAHRQGVIHRDIKPDNILLDKEGHALLADFGIVKIAGGGDSRLTVTGGLVGTPAYMAPEQGTGQTDISGSADIYSLGVVVWEMLTGRQPFTAETPMQVVIKHMTEPLPPLRRDNETLPEALEVVMQRALAKNPQNRYQTASEFADDFTRAIHSSDSLAGIQIDFRPSSDPTMALGENNKAQSPTVASQPSQPTITITQQGMNPLLLLGGFAIIAVLIVAVVALLLGRPTEDADADEADATASAAALVAAVESPTPALPTATSAPSFGRLNFSSSSSPGDTVTLQAQNMRPPAAGELYVAWLVNTEDDTRLKLGDLTLDSLGSGVLPPYTDAEGRVLPAFFNAILITRETASGDAPTGEIVYSASLPTAVMEVMRTIYVTAEDGIEFSRLSSAAYSPATLASGPKAGLLDSALAEANKASQHAGLAQRSGTIGGMHIHNEHTINILLGAQDDLDGNGRGENPGFGTGVALYLDLIGQQLSSAASAPGATTRLQSDLELIRICLDNSSQRMQHLVELEREMLAATDLAAVGQIAIDSTLTAAALINGVDANGNGQVEPFEGECGLQQIQGFGLVAASMTLLEGALPG